MTYISFIHWKSLSPFCLSWKVTPVITSQSLNCIHTSLPTLCYRWLIWYQLRNLSTKWLKKKKVINLHPMLVFQCFFSSLLYSILYALKVDFGYAQVFSYWTFCVVCIVPVIYLVAKVKKQRVRNKNDHSHKT